MPIKQKKKFCTIYKRTDDEKKLHEMSGQLEDTQNTISNLEEKIAKLEKMLESIGTDTRQGNKKVNNKT